MNDELCSVVATTQQFHEYIDVYTSISKPQTKQ